MTTPTIPEGEIEDWLKALKPYQSKILGEYLKTLTPQDAAKQWMTANGAQSVAPFGGQPGAGLFWEQFLAEIHAFFCDEKQYKAEKADWAKKGKTTREWMIATIASVIGAKLGIAGTILAPPVAMFLVTISKMGVNAYCKSSAAQE